MRTKTTMESVGEWVRGEKMEAMWTDNPFRMFGNWGARGLITRKYGWGQDVFYKDGRSVNIFARLQGKILWKGSEDKANKRGYNLRSQVLKMEIDGISSISSSLHWGRGTHLLGVKEKGKDAGIWVYLMMGNREVCVYQAESSAAWRLVD